VIGPTPPFAVPVARTPLSRRTFLAGSLATSGLALAGCGSSATSGGGGGGGSATGEVTFGSNASDAVPKAALESTFAAYKSGANKNEVVPIEGHDADGAPILVDFDEVARADASLDGLMSLKPDIGCFVR